MWKGLKNTKAQPKLGSSWSELGGGLEQFEQGGLDGVVYLFT
jgi:hypothetical protein